MGQLAWNTNPGRYLQAKEYNEKRKNKKKIF